MKKLITGLFIVLFLMPGCGQKKEDPSIGVKSPADTVSSEPPALEQNSIYQTGMDQAPPPDYSFQPVPEEQELPPAEAPDQPPPTD